MRKAAIVVAADARYFEYAKGTVLSIRHKRQGRTLPIYFFDVGLNPSQRDWLRASNCNLVSPGWDIDFPGRDAAPSFFKAMTARPHIPKHVPGYDFYFWIDADAWIQDWTAVECYLEAAAHVGAAFTPEIDRSYCCFYDGGVAQNWMARCYEQAFGKEVADKMYRLPIVNSGVFAAAANSPLWLAWQQTLTSALQRTSDFFVEQTALNLVFYNRMAPVASLPSICNWHCSFALPCIQESTGALLTPPFPATKIGIVHLCGEVKKSNPALLLTDSSQKRFVDLRYPRWNE